jgi:hypothetical protein
MLDTATCSNFKSLEKKNLCPLRQRREVAPRTETMQHFILKAAEEMAPAKAFDTEVWFGLGLCEVPLQFCQRVTPPPRLLQSGARAQNILRFMGADIFGLGIHIALLFFLAGSNMQAAATPHSASASGALETTGTQLPSPEPTQLCAQDSAFVESAGAAAASSAACSESGTPLLALPAPSESSEGDAATQLTLGQRRSLEEELGPLVVNADGTVARISNWKQMTEAERANVLRVLGKRNKERLEVLKGGEARSAGGV